MRVLGCRRGAAAASAVSRVGGAGRLECVGSDRRLRTSTSPTSHGTCRHAPTAPSNSSVLAPLAETSPPSPSSTQPTLSHLTLSWSAYIFSLALALLELVYPRLTVLDADDIIANARRNTRLNELGADEASFRANLQKFAAHCSHNSTALSRFVHRTSAIALPRIACIVAYTRASRGGLAVLRPLVILRCLPGTTPFQSCLAPTRRRAVRGLRHGGQPPRLWHQRRRPTCGCASVWRASRCASATHLSTPAARSHRDQMGLLAEDYPLLHSRCCCRHIATATLCEDGAGGLYDWCTAGGDTRAAYAMYAEVRVLVHCCRHLRRRRAARRRVCC